MINSFHLIFEILLSFTAAQNTHSKNTTQRYENKTQFSTKSNSDLQHLSGEPLRGGFTQTPNTVWPNRPHLSFCSEPFGQEQRTLEIASVPQGTKQFIALNGDGPARPERSRRNNNSDLRERRGDPQHLLKWNKTQILFRGSDERVIGTDQV